MSSSAPKAEILILAEQAQYQKNAVVSSQVLRAESGNVTLFAFDAGQELSEHSTSFDALLQILDGKAEIIISGKSFHMQAGETIILPADEPHAVKATAQFKMLLTMIRA
jgi:quercetin dioxygenase-like cupin family protein